MFTKLSKECLSLIKHGVSLSNYFDEFEYELENLHEMANELTKSAILDNTETYYFKAKIIDIAKGKVINKKNLYLRLSFKIFLSISFIRNWLSFLIKGVTLNIPKTKTISGNFYVARNISRCRPPEYIKAYDLPLYKKRIRPNIKLIIQVIRLSISSNFYIPFYHAYYLIFLKTYDFSKAYFFWEDGGDLASRIINDICNRYGEGSQGFASSELPAFSFLYYKLMCCKVNTNRKVNLKNKSKLKVREWMYYKKYDSACFSKFNKEDKKITYDYGIVLPFFGPDTTSGYSFIEMLLLKINPKENSVLVSIHPQYENIWESYILDKFGWNIRDRSLISDYGFINICKKFIGVDSSLRTLAKDLKKDYELIKN